VRHFRTFTAVNLVMAGLLATALARAADEVRSEASPPGVGNPYLSPERGSTTGVPFELYGHLIVVKGSVGELEDLNLVIDTGATMTVVNRDIARKLGLKGPSRTVTAYGKKLRVEQLTLPSLKLGDLEFEDLPAQAAPLSFSAMDRWLRIDGLIGLDLMRRTSLSVDYETRTVTFGSVDHAGPGVPFYEKLPIVPVPLTVDGRRFNMLLDTGAQHIILFQRRLRGRSSPRANGQRATIVCLGRRQTLDRISLGNVSLGETPWDELSAYLLDVPVGQCDPDGILGVASLGLKRLSLDFENHRVSWER
jgi:predicted aspartyl protease